MTAAPLIVYFSSVTENTHSFVKKLELESVRIGLRPQEDTPPVERPYVLAVPTYGTGEPNTAVPKQVVRFLATPELRALCVGIIGCGNLNFGEKYAAAADVLSRKLGIPVLHRVDLRGTETDKATVLGGLSEHWGELLALRGLREPVV